MCREIAGVLRRYAPVITVALLVVVCIQPASGQGRVYSYVDESGVRVFTNIPPKDTPVLEPETAPRATGKSARRNPTSAVNAGGKSTSLSAERPAATTNPQVSPAAPMLPSDRYDPIIEKYAGQFQLDPSLVRSIIATESGFNPNAVSVKGAGGLMQLMPATASRLGVHNLSDPEENIRGGMKHLRYLLDTFGNDLILSLAAYNAGENLVQRIQRVPNYPETHAYVRSITQRYGKTEMTRVDVAQPVWPRTYRYVDENGYLHLTNIAPTQSMDSDFSFSMNTPAP